MSFINIKDGDFGRAFQAFFNNDYKYEYLAYRDQLLISIGVYAAQGNKEGFISTAKKALNLGLSPDAIYEMILTAGLSRGYIAVLTAQELFKNLSLETKGRDNNPMLDDFNQDYFLQEFNQLPPWVTFLEAHSPKVLKNYAVLRSQLLTDGVVQRKTKEMLTMLLNTFANNTIGIKSHAINAMKYGATRSEILDTLLLGIKIGGIIVWINGVNNLLTELQ